MMNYVIAERIAPFIMDKRRHINRGKLSCYKRCHHVNTFINCNEDCHLIGIMTGNRYWVDGLYLHRVNGPAWVDDTQKRFYHIGKLHRDDGPAIIYENGYCIYYYYGQQYKNQDAYIDAKLHNIDNKCCTKFWRHVRWLI
jgi:hypothetical protein